jgi:hypothetical protein
MKKPGWWDVGRLSRWLHRYIHQNMLVVQQIHGPTTSLTCVACTEPWPCPPYTSAAIGLNAGRSTEPFARDLDWRRQVSPEENAP